MRQKKKTTPPTMVFTGTGLGMLMQQGKVTIKKDPKRIQSKVK